MEKKLYIGNLPYSTTDEALKEMFSQAGTVASASIIIDKFSKRSKGFGFVEMATEEEAAKAKEMFNGSEVEGRKMLVDEARPMKERTFNDRPNE
ncbi:MAG: RNA-binding protein [Candidatus Paceibacterota bacterium]